MFTEGLVPAVYRIIPLDDKGITFTLSYITDRFTVPSKIYGDGMQKVIRIWNDYAIGGKSTGCMLLGDKGSGKTLLSSLLCNLAIDNRLPVITISEINPSIELIGYLSSLKRCVLLFDEFGKIINDNLQDKILTMLSDYCNTHKLFIITENKTFNIHDFIMDRPGRIKYRIDFTKLSKDVFEDYVKEANIDKEFLNELRDCYANAAYFSFDQLQAIVQEHQHYPHETLKEILDVLNVGSLRKNAKIKIVSITDMIDNTELKFRVLNPTNQNIEELKESRIGLILNIEKKDGRLDELNITYNNISALTNEQNEHIIENKGYKIYIVKIYE